MWPTVKLFSLPPANADNRRVTAYLRKRGIAEQVIQNFIDAGLLYEDAKYHNCVFVGKNGFEKPVIVAKRGIYDREDASFRGDQTGSNKKITFRLPCNAKSLRVFVYEPPLVHGANLLQRCC